MNASLCASIIFLFSFIRIIFQDFFRILSKGYRAREAPSQWWWLEAGDLPS